MIDWLTIKCPPCPEFELDGGKVLFISHNGDIDYMIDKLTHVVGSYDEKIGIRANESEVIISGNPTKFLQGHNLFGIDDFKRLFTLFMIDLCHRLQFDMDWCQRVIDGDFEVNRIDLTHSYRLKNEGEVIKWLNAMQQVSTGKRQAIQRSQGTTVYVGKHSRRSAIKFYDKEAEFKKHGLTTKLNDYHEHFLGRWVKGVLRCEVVLRKKCLKDEFKCYRGKDFLMLSENDLRGMYMKKLSTVRIPEKFAINDNEAMKMKKLERAVYSMWQQGINIQEIYPRATAYRYRKMLLENHGIDIFLQSPKDYQKTANVIPLLRPLEAIPCEIPEDAYDLGLLAA